MIERAMGKEGYGLCGPGYVGEEDLESWAGDTEYWEGERREEMVDEEIEGEGERRDGMVGEEGDGDEDVDFLEGGGG